jgi:hypothetical protein
METSAILVNKPGVLLQGLSEGLEILFDGVQGLLLRRGRVESSGITALSSMNLVGTRGIKKLIC